MRLHYQTPEVSELAYFKPVPRDSPMAYTHDVWPGYPAPVLINSASYSWVVGAFGLIPPWADPLFSKNTFTAPMEKIDALLSFRNAWRQRQLCIIPMSCFLVPNYATGRPVTWRVERNDHRVFGVAGLWEVRDYDQSGTHWSFAALTLNAESDPFMSRFFHREEEKRTLLALSSNQYENWLNARVESDIMRLLQPIDLANFCAHEADFFLTS